MSDKQVYWLIWGQRISLVVIEIGITGIGIVLYSAGVIDWLGAGVFVGILLLGTFVDWNLCKMQDKIADREIKGSRFGRRARMQQ